MEHDDWVPIGNTVSQDMEDFFRFDDFDKPYFRLSGSIHPGTSEEEVGGADQVVFQRLDVLDLQATITAKNTLQAKLTLSTENGPAIFEGVLISLGSVAGNPVEAQSPNLSTSREKQCSEAWLKTDDKNAVDASCLRFGGKGKLRIGLAGKPSQDSPAEETTRFEAGAFRSPAEADVKNCQNAEDASNLISKVLQQPAVNGQKDKDAITSRLFGTSPNQEQGIVMVPTGNPEVSTVGYNTQTHNSDLQLGPTSIPHADRPFGRHVYNFVLQPQTISVTTSPPKADNAMLPFSAGIPRKPTVFANFEHQLHASHASAHISPPTRHFASQQAALMSSKAGQTRQDGSPFAQHAKFVNFQLQQQAATESQQVTAVIAHAQATMLESSGLPAVPAVGRKSVPHLPNLCPGELNFGISEQEKVMLTADSTSPLRRHISRMGFDCDTAEPRPGKGVLRMNSNIRGSRGSMHEHQRAPHPTLEREYSVNPGTPPPNSQYGSNMPQFLSYRHELDQGRQVSGVSNYFPGRNCYPQGPQHMRPNMGQMMSQFAYRGAGPHPHHLFTMGRDPQDKVAMPQHAVPPYQGSNPQEHMGQSFHENSIHPSRPVGDAIQSGNVAQNGEGTADISNRISTPSDMEKLEVQLMNNYNADTHAKQSDQSKKRARPRAPKGQKAKASKVTAEKQDDNGVSPQCPSPSPLKSIPK